VSNVSIKEENMVHDSNLTGRLQNPPAHSLLSFGNPVPFIIFSIITTFTFTFSQVSASETDVGTTLLLFCLGFLTFHLQPLMLDHAKLGKGHP
jgi:hypothetical protein